MAKTTKVISMKTPESSSILAKACGSLVLTNCGRKAKKKIESFGFRMLTRMPEVMVLAVERGAASSSMLRPPFSFSVFQAM